MLPRPSRLKSLASEFSPVLTTPPPVEPKTVLVLMSVPEMMLSSNFVVFLRRAAISAAMPPRITSAPAPIAHVGVFAISSSMNEGCGGAALGAGLVTAFGAAAAVASAGVVVAGAGVVGIGAIVVVGSGALAGSAAFTGSGALGGSAFGGSGALTGSAAFGGSGFTVATGGATGTGGGVAATGGGAAVTGAGAGVVETAACVGAVLPFVASASCCC